MAPGPAWKEGKERGRGRSLLLAAALWALLPASASGNALHTVRHWSYPGFTRVAIELEAPTQARLARLPADAGASRPERLYLDLDATKLAPSALPALRVEDGLLLGIRVGQNTPGTVRVVLDLERYERHRVVQLVSPPRIVIDVFGGQAVGGEPAGDVAGAPERVIADPAPARGGDAAPPARSGDAAPPARSGDAAPPARGGDAATAEANPASAIGEAASAMAGRAANPTGSASPERSEGSSPAPASGEGSGPAKAHRLARAHPDRPRGGPGPARPLAGWERRPVRTIVLDPGHGGRDPGCIGLDGLTEKAVTLDLAQRMQERLERWGFRVVMTRSGDETVDLETRTARAEGGGGDVFLSLHVNASPRPALRGIETFYLDHGDERHSVDVAARENGITPEQVGELQSTLAQLRVSEVSERSARLAHHVHGAIVRGLRQRFGDTEDLGVRRGPFYVLFLSSMPAVLIEIGFATNESDAARLRDDTYLELLADRIASGLMAYAIASSPVVAATGPSPVVAASGPSARAAGGAP